MSEGRRYRILSTIGQGGYGTVYLAELQGAGGFVRQVAVKVVNAGAGATPEQVRQLRDEARILGLLRHRAVVTVDSLSRLDDGWAVVMEYVPGIDLSALILDSSATGASGDAEGTPVPVVVEIVEEVAAALHTAYAEPAPIRGVPLQLVHRDIKPANIRVTAQGEVKVLDFGIALLPGGRARPVGTSRYAAPERAGGRFGPEVDVYALGLVAAEILAGIRSPSPPLPEAPGAALAHAAWVSRVLEAARAGARASTPDASDTLLDQLDVLLRRCLDFDPAGRPTARDVVQWCRTLREQLSTPALRTWAETVVPARQAGPRSSRDVARPPDLLLDGTSTTAQPPAPPPPTRNRAVLMGAGIGFMAAVLFAVLIAATQNRRPVEAVEPASAGWATRDGSPLAPDPVETPGEPPKSPEVAVAAPSSGGAGVGGGIVGVVAPNPAVLTLPASAVPAEPTSAPVGEPGSSLGRGSGRLVVEGDALEVRLERRGKAWTGGVIPAGTYSLFAAFEAGESLPLGEVEIRGGETTRLRCARAMMVCKEVR